MARHAFCKKEKGWTCKEKGMEEKGNKGEDGGKLAMSIVYRPHRELLADAMAEIKYFSCIKDMIKYVKEEWASYYPNLDVVIDDTEIDDDRIGWHHTRYVCIKMDSFEYPQCVGMCDLVSFN